MLHVRIGPSKMARPSIFRFWKFLVAALSVAVVSTFLIQKYSDLLNDSRGVRRKPVVKLEKKALPQCPTILCPADHFSFFIQSGAADAVPPLICFNNELLLGIAKKNCGVGINLVVLDGKTGDIINTGNYDMYSGDVAPLIEFLKEIPTGTIVLIASYDEPSSKLTDEARELILSLGSSMIKNIAFRDNWIFVGGKGANIKTTFEKVLKRSDNNVYQGWPELIDISGCIPKYTGTQN